MSGRKIKIPQAANGVAFFDFSEICEKEYGAMDFIALCRNLDTIMIKNVPKLDIHSRNLSRRFILLVLYKDLLFISLD